MKELHWILNFFQFLERLEVLQVSQSDLRKSGKIGSKNLEKIWDSVFFWHLEKFRAAGFFLSWEWSLLVWVGAGSSVRAGALLGDAAQAHLSPTAPEQSGKFNMRGEQKQNLRTFLVALLSGTGGRLAASNSERNSALAAEFLQQQFDLSCFWRDFTLRARTAALVYSNCRYF